MEHRTTLQPEPTSASEARRFVVDTLPSVDPQRRDVAMLLTSELVTNAILHSATEGDIEVAVDLRGPVVRVEVSDTSSDPPRVRRLDLTATSGRGLALVAALATAWGVERIPNDGKRVWFEVAV